MTKGQILDLVVALQRQIDTLKKEIDEQKSSANCKQSVLCKKICIYERISNLDVLEALIIDAFSQSSALLSKIDEYNVDNSVKLSVSDLNIVIKKIRDFEFCIKRNKTFI